MYGRQSSQQRLKAALHGQTGLYVQTPATHYDSDTVATQWGMGPLHDCGHGRRCLSRQR